MIILETSLEAKKIPLSLAIYYVHLEEPVWIDRRIGGGGSLLLSVVRSSKSAHAGIKHIAGDEALSCIVNVADGRRSVIEESKIAAIRSIRL